MSNNSYIVRTSKDNLYRFYINDGNLTVERFEKFKKINTYIFIKDILEYSLYIDKNDKIYIVYITNKRQLMYIDFSGNSSPIEIPHLTGEILIYSIGIISVNSIVHIFFVANDKNKQCSYLYHCYLNSNEWINEKVTEVDYSKYTRAYFLDFYQKDIYIFYCRNSALEQYTIIKYNTSNKELSDFENNILIKDISNLKFLISPKGIGLIYFNKIVNNNAETHALYKDFNNLNSVWSYNNISDNNSNALKSIIFCKNNIFYYLWNIGTNMVYKKSNNLINWSKKFEIGSKEVNMDRLTYLSNFSQDKDLKINSIYFSYLKTIYQIIDPKLIYSYERLSMDNLEDSHSNVAVTLEESPICFMLASNRIIKGKDSYIDRLRSDLEDNDKTIKKLNRLIESYKIELKKLEVEVTNKSYENLDTNNYYEMKIAKLREEMDNLTKNTNERIMNLLNIIDEKEQIITKLYNITKSKK